MHLFTTGQRVIVALQRTKPAQGDEDVALTSPTPMSVTDLRSGQNWGRTRTLTVKLDAVEPTILQMTSVPDHARP